MKALRRLRRIIVLAGLAALAAYLTWRDSESVTGHAVVMDGDSLRVGGAEIRLEGLDAPELGQTCTARGMVYRCGETSRAALSRIVDGRFVTCTITGRDRYRRKLGRCAVGDADIGAMLVRGGDAVAYGDYEREEAQARAQRRGLWAGAFQTPADWRAERRRADGR